MKLRLVLALALVLGVLAPAPSFADSVKIGIAYDIGGRGDKSFNDAAAAGIEKARKTLDFTVEPVVTDGTSADREKRIRSLIAKNCNLVIAVGGGYGPTLQALAFEFPDTQFAIINDASVAAVNVSSVIFAETQGAYLAGFSAAQISKTGKVAMIANTNQADLFKNGFSAGVLSSKKKVIPVVKYVSGSYSLAASQVISAGADVIFLSTQGSDFEVFKVIVANNAKKNSKSVGLINIEPDQYLAVTNQTKRFLVATMVKRVDKAIIDIISKTIDGDQFLDYLDLDAGLFGKRYGITGGGIEFTIRSRELQSKGEAINIAAASAEKILA
ncbi:MAG: BMP family ABC transporter substrate-binding protein [Actinobacteria bacterium]|nr:BMP family ABC transporter substrate-binding protein [Actinomycetota bacterium]